MVMLCFMIGAAGGLLLSSKGLFAKMFGVACFGFVLFLAWAEWHYR